MKKKIMALAISSAMFVSGFSMANDIEHLKLEYFNDGDKSLQFKFSENAKKPSILKSEINTIHLVFSDVSSELSTDDFDIYEEGIKDISTKMEGNDLHVLIRLVNKHDYSFSKTENFLTMTLENNGITYNDISEIITHENRFLIDDVSFSRENNEQSKIIISHNSEDLTYEAVEFEGGVELTFQNAEIPAKLFTNNDVSEFSTPINSFITRIEDGKVSVKIFYNDNYKANYLTTNIDNKLVVIVNGLNYKKPVKSQKEISEDFEDEGLVVKSSGFHGELISFDFQNVPIKNALYVIAKKRNLNLVLGDNISGRLTLLLEDVPYDQAIDIILRTKGLGKYIEGNVLLIAPLEEIVQRQEFELKSKNKIAEIAPLKSNTVQIKYAKSSEVFALLETLKSDRGSIIYDERTNKMFIEDTAKKLFEMQNLIHEIDIPVRQVSVEARIVYAKKSKNDELGVIWGAGIDSANYTSIGGSNIGVKDGSTIGSNGSSSTNPLNLTLGFLNANIDATLSALESKGDVEIVARPLVIAANKTTSRISSGKEYPYYEISDNGDVTTSFKEIVLSLDVTPQITPNNKLILDLEIIQDSIAEITEAGPALDTTKITTKVIVSNNETLVLGGVFKEAILSGENQVPLLGDIPYLGNAFKYQEDSLEQIELLIFITPKILGAEDILIE